jgi:hypothetical protein
MQMLMEQPARSENAFANLESHLMAMDKSGDMLVEATAALRNSARIFAAATARLQASSKRRRPSAPVATSRSHLRLIKR